MKVLLLMIFVLRTCSWFAYAHSDEEDIARRERISRFLETRKRFSPLCLYTFDRTKKLPSVEHEDAKSDANSTRVDTFFEDHLPGVCPFGDLQFDSALVASLNTEAHSYQLGARIAGDPGQDAKRIQIASTDIVSVQDFYNLAAIASDVNENGARSSGVTFEIVIRRRTLDDADMTLFSIANLYDGCVGPGFRVDIDNDRRLVLLYYLPVLANGKDDLCYAQLLVSDEQILFSDMRTTCLFPRSLRNPEDNPPVFIAVTIDPSSSKGLWKTEFAISYTDPVTMERVNCRVHTQRNPPRDARLLQKRLRGNYRLYIGNNPHNVSFPKVQHPLVPRRQFRPLGREDMSRNATEQLRHTLYEKLMSIEGPRIPEAMRIFGNRSFSLRLFGLEFPPINEDSPFAYLRGKLKDFLVSNGAEMVNALIDMLRKVQPAVEQVEQTADERLVQRLVAQAENDTAFQFYPDAHMSTFDLFHFAIYKQARTPEDLDAGNWTQLTALRPFPGQTREIRVQEDEVVLVDLLDMHSVHDDLVLELRALPEFGKLMLFPNKTVVAAENMTAFRDLPMKYQRKIFFQPNADQNNGNIPLPNPLALSRRRRPYSMIQFGIWKSVTGRSFNSTANASIHIFVDPVNDPPRPLKPVQEVLVAPSAPILLALKGEDVDGSPLPPVKEEEKVEEKNEDESLEHQFADAFNVPDMAPLRTPPPQQFLKVARLPQYGKLYDRHRTTPNQTLMLPITYDRSALEPYRIALDDIANGTFSTDLLYVYGGWDRHDDADVGGGGAVVDELWYQLSDGADGVYSDLAVVRFTLDPRGWQNANDSSSLAVLQLKEDTSSVIALAEIEPLVGLLDPRAKFRITDLPRYGSLYQFNARERNGDSDSSVPYRIGKRIDSSNNVVDDMDGRLVYIPDRDYFNMLPPNDSTRAVPASFGSDAFAFEPANVSGYFESMSHSMGERSGSIPVESLPSVALRPRVIQIQVMNEPDELIVFPPMRFVSNQTQSEPVQVPVLFDDPDALYSGQYQAILEAKDGVSRLELGPSVSNDDVMRFCNITRPCMLARSINKNRTKEEARGGDGDEEEDSKLTYLVQHVLFNPSHIAVLGSKKAVQTALSQLMFRDWSGSWGKTHRAHFTVTIKRVDGNGGASEEVRAEFFVDYLPWSISDFGDVGEKIVGLVLNQLEEFLWTLAMTVLVCMLITSASCFTSGCCCCCCSRARHHRRKQFEDERTQFLQQVAQNDYEYSVLLMEIADMILEPNLVFATCFVRCLRFANGSGWSETLKVLCLQSLIPVLESERQATRFVFRLMVVEFEEASVDGWIGRSKAEMEGFQNVYLAESSCASQALTYFCRYIGRDWLRCLMVTFAGDMKSHHGDHALFTVLLEQMSYAVADLPVEIVILCRACARMFLSDERNVAEPSSFLFRAIHSVFFNHFIGPALRFDGEDIFGINPNTAQRRRLIDMACHFTDLAQRWDLQQQVGVDEYVLLSEEEHARDVREQLSRYELLLYTIATSYVLQSSFDPSEKDVSASRKGDRDCGVDCDLMAMCLMSVHSFLDSFFPHFEREHAQLQTAQQRDRLDGGDDKDSLVVRLRRLLQALSFPSASIHTLLEHRNQDHSSEWYYASTTGCSFQEWREFAAEQRSGWSLSQRRQDSIRQTKNEKKKSGGVVLSRSHSLLAVHIEDNVAADAY